MVFRTAVMALLLLAGGGALLAWAQNETLRDDAVLDPLATRSRSFLQDISVGDIDDAFRKLLAQGPLAGSFDATQALREKAAQLDEKYGDCRGVEQVAVRRLGNDVVIFKYLYKCEQIPVIWQFTYYRSAPRPNLAAADPWHLIAVRFDTALDDLLP